MNEREYETDTLTGAQITELLHLVLESATQAEFHRLVDLASDELLREARNGLEVNQLGLAEGACLVDVNELTLKSWLRGSKPLPEEAHEKLAGLCLGLSLAKADDAAEATALASAAVSASRNEPTDGTGQAYGEAIRILGSVFGPAGLMAAALHSAMQPAPAGTVSRTGD